MIALSGLLAVTAFALGSMYYVYRLRGRERFANLTEYLRKGWWIFAPINCLLYLTTRRKAAGPTPEPAQFADLQYLRDNWNTMRDEALDLYRTRQFEAVGAPGSASYYDVGFRSFYKYGWSKFYLKWYGYCHDSAQRLCPRTVEILKKAPSVNGAMFSLLPPGSKLTRHLDPLACSLRYHLGLSTPNDDRCFINIDGNVHSWRDGQDLVFDETYLHFARNDSDEPRLILMCDIERPTNMLGSVVKAFHKALVRLTVVPNMEGDRRGFANRVFSGLSPILKQSKAMKQTHPVRYRVTQFSVNTFLVGTVLLTIYGLIELVEAALSLV